MRICSLLPSATEMLYAIGAGRSVVARSEHCTYPASVKSKPVVVRSRVKKLAKLDSLAIHKAVLKLRQENSHQFDLDVAALKRLKPDLVVTQTLCNVCAASHSEVALALRELSPSPKVVSLQAQQLSQVPQDLKRLGEATGREAATERVVRKLQNQTAQIQKKLRSVKTRPRVWCCEWLEPLMAAGHWIPELVRFAGGADRLGTPGGNSSWITWDQVRSFDPEVILVMPCSYSIQQSLREKQRLTRRAGWKKLSAVKTGKVFAIETSFAHHAGPRLVEGIKLFAHLIHPEIKLPGSWKKYYRQLS